MKTSSTTKKTTKNATTEQPLADAATVTASAPFDHEGDLLDRISRELDWLSSNMEEVFCGSTGDYCTNAARAQMLRTRGMLAELRSFVEARQAVS